MRSSCHRILVLLIVVLVSTNSRGNEQLLQEFKWTGAADCTSVRLDKDDGVMSKIPVQDQGRSLVCWAYTASQMIDAWHAKHDPNRLPITSPMDLAVRYSALTNQKNLIVPLSSGDVLDNIHKMELCPRIKINDYHNGKPLTDLMSLALKARSEFTAGGSETTLVTRINDLLRDFGFDGRFSPASIKKYRTDATILPFLNDVFRAICSEGSRVAPNFPKVGEIQVYKYSRVSDGIAAVQNLIHKKLNERNPLPVSISFCRSVLADRDVSTLDMSGRTDKEKCKTSHAAVIVGRRLVMFKDTDGKEYPFCQFLVRDSYGASCSKYPDDPEITPSNRCDNGQVWVDESALLTNTSEVLWLRDK